jgi:hypothetical protein
MQAGALQQAQEQKGLDVAYQQYQDSLNYPYKQLGFMSDIYRGLPMAQSAQSMYQNPSAISQAVGLGTAGYGMYQMSKKEGGAIKEKRMADGGITQLFDVGGSVKADLSRMSPQELQEYIAKSSSPTAKRMAQEILSEKAFMAKQQQSAGVTQLPSNLPAGEAMAGGGIIAFADEGVVRDTDPGAQGVQAVSDAVFERLAAEREAANTGDLGIAPLVAPATAPVAARAPAATSAPIVNPILSTYGGIPTMSPETKEAFSQYAGMYKDMRGDNKKAREEAKYMALMQAGFGIAGGTSPNAFANINQGVQPAMAQYQSALKDIRKDDREALKGLVDLGLSKEQFLQKAQQMGIDVYKADKVFEAHELSAKATVAAAGIRAAAEKTPPRPTDQRAFVTDFIAQARAKGDKTTPDAVLAVQGAERYLEQSRPVQSNLAGVAGLASGEQSAADKAMEPFRTTLKGLLYSGNEKRIAEVTRQMYEAGEKARSEYIKSTKGVQSNRPSANASATANPATSFLTNPQSTARPSAASAAAGTGGAGAANAPSLSAFLEAARKANPGVSDEQLTAYYKQKYGR